MLTAGVPADFADALFDQATERLRHPQSRIALDTHARFGIRPTTFAEFLQRHKQVFSQAA